MRHLRVLQIMTITTITLLASCGNNDRTVTAGDGAQPTEATTVATETSVESCGGIGDVFQLDAPGSYVAFAIHSSGSLLTEVRGNHGELLANTDQVFEVEASVFIHIQHDDSPYELFVVRVDGTREFSGLNLRPPVEHVVNESGSCLIGDLRETFKIHTDAVYSDARTPQIFVVDSPS